jgi:hypothetical protein
MKSTEEPKCSKLHQIIKDILQTKTVPKPMQNKCVRSRTYSLDQGLANYFRDRPDFAGQQDVVKIIYTKEQKTASAQIYVS